MSIKKILALTAALVLAAGALAETDPAAQRAAMGKLAWLAGQWEGTAATRGREGEARSASTETVRLAAGGTALLIQGRHYRLLPDGGRGDVVHDTAAMLTFDPESGKYRFTTQLQTGQGGVFDGTVEGATFSWRLPLPGGYARYDIARNDKGQWSELGFFCREGAQFVPIFRMALERKGDAP
jgi:hypothetical protein